MVSLDIEPKDEEHRKIYFEKIESLKDILTEEYIYDVIFERNYQLDNGKIISRIWVEIENISINNKSTWHKVFEFFDKNMTFLEQFFYEYGDYIKDLEINT
jgi:hypothetical protein